MKIYIFCLETFIYKCSFFLFFLSDNLPDHPQECEVCRLVKSTADSLLEEQNFWYFLLMIKHKIVMFLLAKLSSQPTCHYVNHTSMKFAKTAKTYWTPSRSSPTNLFETIKAIA